MKNTFYISFIFLFSFFISCNKKDGFTSYKITDYMNLSIGKYVTYRLDSLKYVGYGQKDTIISYQAKDVVEGALTDNLGRPSWRVVRYLNDTAARGQWKVDMAYMVTATREELEIVENNLRFLKLKLPIIDDFSWKGNSYINTLAPADPINEVDLRYLKDWDYIYTKVSQPYTTSLKVPINNTITINQKDEVLGTIGNIDSYSEKIFSEEIYGEKIGLVYKQFIHWVFQPRTSNYPNGYYEGFGITLRIIDHN